MKAFRPSYWLVIIGVTALVVCAQVSAYGQGSNLKGTWINARMEAILIDDTTGKSNTNYLSTGNFHRPHDLVQQGDTLDFTNSYTSPSTQFKQVYVERSTFTFTQPNPHTLVLVPVSELAEKFFGSRQPIVLNRQESTVDSTIHFERLAFASGPCDGTCPIYGFTLDSSGRLRLHVSDIYKNGLKAVRKYFVGQLPDSLQRRLVNALQTCYLRQWAIASHQCCDAPLQTLIVYFNGQQKMFSTEFPPIIVEKLINVLQSIYETCPRQRVKTPFVIENPAKRIR